MNKFDQILAEEINVIERTNPSAIKKSRLISAKIAIDAGIDIAQVANMLKLSQRDIEKFLKS